MNPSPRFRLALLALCTAAATPVFAAKKSPMQKVEAIDPEWDDRGIDTTQPQWYRKHPFWTHIEKPFRKECDSIVAGLKDSVPSKPDTIAYFAKGKVEGYPDSIPGKGLHFYGKGLILRPQLLRSEPYQGKPVGILRPENGPWKVPLVYRPEGIFYPKRPDPLEKASFDRDGHHTMQVVKVTSPKEILGISFPGFKALVVNDSGRKLGWLPVDSIAMFPDCNDAKASAPFYRDGIAAFVHGVWTERNDAGVGEEDYGNGRNNDALVGLGVMEVKDMIHLWQITLRPKEYDEKSPPTFLRKCLFRRGSDTWLSNSCVEQATKIPLQYFYEEAGWEKFRRIQHVEVEGSGRSKSFGFILYDSLGVKIDALVSGAKDNGAENGHNAGYGKCSKELVP
jgi:hypothetical protein